MYSNITLLEQSVKITPPLTMLEVSDKICDGFVEATSEELKSLEFQQIGAAAGIAWQPRKGSKLAFGNKITIRDVEGPVKMLYIHGDEILSSGRKRGTEFPIAYFRRVEKDMLDNMSDDNFKKYSLSYELALNGANDLQRAELLMNKVFDVEIHVGKAYTWERYKDDSGNMHARIKYDEDHNPVTKDQKFFWLSEIKEN